MWKYFKEEVYKSKPTKSSLVTKVEVTEIIKVIYVQIAGVQIWPLRNNPDGTFDLDDMEEKVRNHTDDHEPMTSLICVENTQNWCGGRVLSLEWLDDVSNVGSDFNIFRSPFTPVIVTGIFLKLQY